MLSALSLVATNALTPSALRNASNSVIVYLVICPVLRSLSAGTIAWGSVERTAPIFVENATLIMKAFRFSSEMKTTLHLDLWNYLTASTAS